jgi:O-antigen/teichoic acid export membrane protein
LKKKFLSNLVLLLILNLLIKPFWFFGIEVSVQNAVGEEMYGFYFALFNFAFIMNILLDVGITNFNNRSISRDHSLLNEYLSTIIPIRFLLSFVYAIIVFTAAWIVGYSMVEFRLLIFLVINQFLASFIMYLRSNIAGLQLFRTDSLLSVLDRTLMIIFTALLLWTNITGDPYRIEWFVYTQTVSYLITFAVVLSIVLARSGRLKFTLSFSRFKSILRQSYPFALLILLMSFFYRIDSVMIERLLPNGDEQAGIYAQSFRIMDALTQFAILFTGLLLPMFSKMLKTGEKVSDLIILSSSLLLSASVFVAVIGLFHAEDVITLLYHESEFNSSTIFSLLMFSFIFLSLSNIYGTLLTANKSMKQLNLLALFTVVLNVGLNLLLIPRLNALGAAYANLFSQAFFATGQVILTYGILHLRPAFSFTIRACVFGLILLGTGYLSSRYLNPLPSLLCITAIAAVASVTTSLIKPKEMLMILKEGE